MSSNQEEEPAEPPEPELVQPRPRPIPKHSILEMQEDPAFQASSTQTPHAVQDVIGDYEHVANAAQSGQAISHIADNQQLDEQSIANDFPSGFGQTTNHAINRPADHAPPPALPSPPEPPISVQVSPSANPLDPTPSAPYFTPVSTASDYADSAGANGDYATGLAISQPTSTQDFHQQSASADVHKDYSTQVPDAVNLQAILDKFSPSQAASFDVANASNSHTDLAQVQEAGPSDPTNINNTHHLPLPSLPAAPGLPARPPSNSASTNNFSESDLRSHHPHDNQPQHQHSGQPTQSVQKYVSFQGHSMPTPGNLPPPPMPNAGAPGTSLSSSNLPPPPVPTFQQSNSSGATAGFHERDLPRLTSNDGLGDDIIDRRWGPEVQRKYDEFLEEERKWVARGEWHNFPSNSRLFIGNLPSEKVTKRDLFHVFHKYGRLAQVSIKQAYGFIQYLRAESCLRALQAEQGVSVRGRRIHLEISKPPKSTQTTNPTRRSRSPPEHNRGPTASGSPRAGERHRGRDAYRPGRSPSPRPRESRRSPNNPGRRRSRSPPPRRRSPSPRRSPGSANTLPARHPSEVVDLQIILKSEMDRSFVHMLQDAFKARQIRSSPIHLNGKVTEAVVVRRHIFEGGLAVLLLDRGMVMSQKFDLTIFDRSAGSENVKYNEYKAVALNICVELVVRAKQVAMRQMQPTSQYYGLPVAPVPSVPGMPPQQQNQQGLPMPLPPYQQILAQQQQQHLPPTSLPPLDSASLQQILSRVQQPPPQQMSPGAAHSPFGGQQFPPPTDLSRLLASAGVNQSPTTMNPNVSQALANLLNNQGSNPTQTPIQMPPQPPGPPQSQSHVRHASQHSPPGPPQLPQPPQPGPADIQNIMSMLSRYR